MCGPRADSLFGRTLLVTLTVLAAAASARSSAQAPPDVPVATRRAVSYLVAEVPRWRREHPCYSCHNNGDGARALIEASRRNLVDLQRVDDAIGWLRSPERWALNSEDGGVKDLPLSRIQFAAALQALASAGAAEQGALDRAAALVVADQRPDGSWPISATSNVGTPTGYGTPLATAVAMRLLAGSRTEAAGSARTRAGLWLRALEPQAVLEASAVLLGVGAASDEPAAAVRRKALDILRRGQAPDGGWGPYTTTPSEPFDTAVAMIALLTLRDNVSLAGPVLTPAGWRSALDRGRAYLLAQQNDDGSWPETTRPALQDSYSQRVSTTAWALIALLDLER